MAPILSLLSLLSFIFFVTSDVERRTPAGLVPFTVDIRSNTNDNPFPLNQFRVAASGSSYIPPRVNGLLEVDIVECETLSPRWNSLRGDVTYLATTTALSKPAGSAYEINGYIYPRSGQPSPTASIEAADCYTNAGKYFVMPKMEKAKGTFVIPNDNNAIKRFTVSNNPFQNSLTWQLVRFRVAPQNCISSSNKYFIPKTEPVSSSDAKVVCSGLGSTLVDVNFKNIQEINELTHSCYETNQKFYVASWNGYDFGLGSMIFTSSVDATSNGAVTVPDNGNYFPICQRIMEGLHRDSITDDIIFIYDSEGMDFMQGQALCQQEERPLANLVPPATDNLEDKTSTWIQARILLSTNNGPYSSGWIGAYNGAPADNLAFFNGGNNIYDRGAVSIPPGGSNAKLNGVFCGSIKTQVRRSEL